MDSENGGYLMVNVVKLRKDFRHLECRLRLLTQAELALLQTFFLIWRLT